MNPVTGAHHSQGWGGIHLHLCTKEIWGTRFFGEPQTTCGLLYGGRLQHPPRKLVLVEVNINSADFQACKGLTYKVIVGTEENHILLMNTTGTFTHLPWMLGYSHSTWEMQRCADQNSRMVGGTKTQWRLGPHPSHQPPRLQTPQLYNLASTPPQELETVRMNHDRLTPANSWHTRSKPSIHSHNWCTTPASHRRHNSLLETGAEV